jgi:hypothetical protein
MKRKCIQVLLLFLINSYSLLLGEDMGTPSTIELKETIEVNPINKLILWGIPGTVRLFRIDDKDTKLVITKKALDGKTETLNQINLKSEYSTSDTGKVTYRLKNKPNARLNSLVQTDIDAYVPQEVGIMIELKDGTFIQNGGGFKNLEVFGERTTMQISEYRFSLGDKLDLHLQDNSNATVNLAPTNAPFSFTAGQIGNDQNRQVAVNFPFSSTAFSENNKKYYLFNTTLANPDKALFRVDIDESSTLAVK